MKAGQMLLLVLLGIVAIVATNTLFIVRETEQAMVLAFGKIESLVAEPGLHAKLPFIQQVMFFDKRILETDSPVEEVQAGDKKRVVVDSFTRWRIIDAKSFFEKVRNENVARQRLNTIVNSNIRRALGDVPLNDMITDQREEVMSNILEGARIEAKAFGIEIVDVRIKRADLPQRNSKAVFQRMHTEREKEAKEIRAKGAEDAQVIRASAEKKRTIILAEANRDAEKLRGQGDGEAIRVLAVSTNQDPEFYSFIRSLEAYEKSMKDQDTLMVLDPSVKFFKHFGGAK